MANRVLVEVCCGSVDDVVEAGAGGADRVELCSALFLGGLTASVGAIAEGKSRVKIPIVAMVRPRPGGFAYSEADFATAERDVDAALEAGADGVVFGVLAADGRVDVERTAALVKRAGGKQTVFHRAFDVVADPFQALEELVDVGVARVLTSGQQSSALDGAQLIRRLVEAADGRIEVMAGGGLRPGNVRKFVEETGCGQVHLAAMRQIADTSTRLNPTLRYGDLNSPSEEIVHIADRVQVRATVDALG